MKKLLTTIFAITLLSLIGFTQNVSLEFNADLNELYAPVNLNAEVFIEGVTEGEPAYLKVNNTLSGYTKLKFGNNNHNIYSPKVSVLNGGNQYLEIDIKTPDTNIDWNKIKLRPEAKGSLNLASYVDQVGGVANEWKTLRIPLEDFSSDIDFNSISYMEFPYSAAAGAFELDISRVEFVGGAYPYLWFGEGKLDNIHDGNGGSYRMTASVVDAVPVENNVEKVELFIDNVLYSTDVSIPFEFNCQFEESGNYEAKALVSYNDGSTSESSVIPLNIQYLPPPDLSCSIVSPANNEEVEVNTAFEITAETSGAPLNESTFLKIINENSGYRKLKFGYDSQNLYGARQNVVLGGNTHMEITLRTNGAFSNWSKIRIRPSSIGSLNLEPYITEVGGVFDEWKTISIPLEDFSSSIDFSQLQLMEFPYSADAGPFEMDIQKIEFTGGDQNFLWFGETKTDNKHDGMGGSGQLTATLQEFDLTDETLEKVEFYVNDELINSDYFAPFKATYQFSEEAENNIYAIAYLFDGTSAQSENISVTSLPQANPVSPVHTEIVQPITTDSALVQETIQIIPSYSGIQLDSVAYLKAWNAETGYRKLKIGIDDQYIYSGHANVIESGNTHLEIELKSLSNNINWNKIRIRPSAKGVLNLSNYLSEEPTDWTSISIPLTDFDAGINFADISFIEFPYSADAGAFNIGIKSIKFTGGTEDFIWFDQDNHENAHDGTGGGGKIFAEVFEPDPNAVSIVETSLLINGEVAETQAGRADAFNYAFQEAGVYNIQIKTIDSDGLIAYSEVVPFKIYEENWTNYSKLDIVFANPPSDLDVKIAALKYNKDFAYSFTLDDGKYDGYDYAFQLFNGGFIEELNESCPGLYYTDGCGNDIAFTGGLAWNSVNSSFSDIHINTPDYMTWDELSIMYAAGWNVYNHSYSHAAYGETDYQFQVQQNQTYVNSKTGINMSHFVIPSGDLNYVTEAFDQGMLAVYSNKVQFNGYPSGIDIDPPFNTTQQQIYRRFLYDDNYNTSNISEKIDAIASSVNSSNHIWFSEFTHRILNEPIGGSLIWPTFKFYMEHIEQNYGKDGLDNIWFTGMEDVLNYLIIRENTGINYSIDGNVASIYLDFSNLPENLPKYEISLVVDSPEEILEISPDFQGNFDYNPETGLVNISWSQNTMKSMTFTGFEEVATNAKEESIIIYPNPVRDGIIYITPPEHTQIDKVAIYDLAGVLIDEFILSSKDTNQYPLNLNKLKLNSGTYIIRILSNDANVYYKKIEII